jgi:hypothetical protein
MGWPIRTAFFLAQLSALALNSVLLVSRVQAAEGCTLAKAAEIPIAMSGTRPIITAKINNQDARFLLDSGAVLQHDECGDRRRIQLEIEAGSVRFEDSRCWRLGDCPGCDR